MALQVALALFSILLVPLLLGHICRSSRNGKKKKKNGKKKKKKKKKKFI